MVPPAGSVRVNTPRSAFLASLLPLLLCGSSFAGNTPPRFTGGFQSVFVAGDHPRPLENHPDLYPVTDADITHREPTTDIRRWPVPKSPTLRRGSESIGWQAHYSMGHAGNADAVAMAFGPGTGITQMEYLFYGAFEADSQLHMTFEARWAGEEGLAVRQQPGAGFRLVGYVERTPPGAAASRGRAGFKAEFRFLDEVDGRRVEVANPISLYYSKRTPGNIDQRLFVPPSDSGATVVDELIVEGHLTFWASNNSLIELRHDGVVSAGAVNLVPLPPAAWAGAAGLAAVLAAVRLTAREAGRRLAGR